MKLTIITLAALIFSAGLASAQTAPPTRIACLGNADMAARFVSGDTASLPNYATSVGARVQRQHPNTALIGHTKYIDYENMPVGICVYSNHVGVVASFALRGALADAGDGACDDGSCLKGAYWRSEWIETDAEADRPGKEQLYVCMNNLGQTAIPSTDCLFNRPPQQVAEPEAPTE